jgi:hypothetical protein
MRMLLAEDKPAGVHSSRRSMPKRVHGARFNVSKGARQCEKELARLSAASILSSEIVPSYNKLIRSNNGYGYCTL